MPASTSTAVHAATRFYGRWKATAACSARTRISAARRCRRLRPRGTSGLRPEAEPCPRAAQAYGIARGCTSETCGQGRGADRCTQAGSRSEGRLGCVCERRSSRANSTPRGIAGGRTIGTDAPPSEATSYAGRTWPRSSPERSTSSLTSSRGSRSVKALAERALWMVAQERAG